MKEPKDVFGIDISKDWIDAAPWIPSSGEDLRKLPVRRFSRDGPGAKAILEWAQQLGFQNPWFVMEATGSYSEEFAQELVRSDPKANIAIVNPGSVRFYAKSLPIRGKTDAMDARVLARFGSERALTAWAEIPAIRKERRGLTRLKTALTEDLVRLRLRHQTSDGQAARLLVQSIKAMERMLDRTERAIARLDAKDPERKTLFKRWQSIPGIGPCTASIVWSELGDLRQFERSRAVAAASGLAPRPYTSGSSIRGKSRICRQGNAHVRAVLYMAAIAAIRVDGPLKTFYLRLCENGKPKMQALCAVMRKLLVLMRAISLSGNDYTPKHMKQTD